MKRCGTCNQVLPRAAWSMDAFTEALKTFRKEYLAAWAIANERALEEAHDENRAWERAYWKKILDGDPEMWGDEPESTDLEAIATSRPRVAWLCRLPLNWRRWWRSTPQGMRFLVGNYPEVTEEEWSQIFPAHH